MQFIESGPHLPPTIATPLCLNEPTLQIIYAVESMTPLLLQEINTRPAWTNGKDPYKLRRYIEQELAELFEEASVYRLDNDVNTTPLDDEVFDIAFFTLQLAHELKIPLSALVETDWHIRNTFDEIVEVHTPSKEDILIAGARKTVRNLLKYNPENLSDPYANHSHTEARLKYEWEINGGDARFYKLLEEAGGVSLTDENLWQLNDLIYTLSLELREQW